MNTENTDFGSRKKLFRIICYLVFIKKRIKEQKKLAKQIEIEEKKRIKEKKKIVKLKKNKKFENWKIKYKTKGLCEFLF